MDNTATSRAEMISRLTRVQNSLDNMHRDILTITGFMDDKQVAAHLAFYESKETAQAEEVTR